MSEDDADFFELSAPLRDAFETINEYLLRGSKTPTTNVESEQQSNQIEWAHKVIGKIMKNLKIAFSTPNMNG